ncbi:hypothetical protein ACFX2B_011983 [Malus domestica]
MDTNQRVQPQKRKKKQSIQAKAKDSTTVINVHTTSSSIEKLNPPTLCKFKLHPEVKYERSNIPVHDHRNIPNQGMEKSKSSQLKAEEYHLAAHMRNQYMISQVFLCAGGELSGTFNNTKLDLEE